MHREHVCGMKKVYHCSFSITLTTSLTQAFAEKKGLTKAGGTYRHLAVAVALLRWEWFLEDEFDQQDRSKQ